MRQIYSTTLRLNLADPEEREAWEHLRHIDRRKYHSVSKAVVAAVNAYFGRLELLKADPYLETREKEDAFLREIIDTIKGALPYGASSIHLSHAIVPQVKTEESDEDADAALSFADDF